VKMAVDEIIALRAADPVGLARMLRWSFGVHVFLVVFTLVVPRDWITTDRTPPQLMRVNLGAGTPGPRSTGQTPTGRRAVEQVAPPPVRPEPILPSVSRPDRPPATVDTPPKTTPPPPPPDVDRPTAPLRRPPATGERVQSGTSPAETGAQTEGQGVTFGGGYGQAMVDLATCYCEGYLRDMIDRIQGQWKSDLGNGTTVIQYTVHRDGSLSDITMVRESGVPMLDLEARRVLTAVRLGPLPPLYPDETMVIRLTFPYRR